MKFRVLLVALATVAMANSVLAQQATADPYVERNKQVQERLRQLGFYDGPVNGVVGPNTQAAIAQFQLSWPLAVSGMLDADTLAALGVEPAQAASAGASEPPAQQGEVPSEPAREAPPPGQG